MSDTTRAGAEPAAIRGHRAWISIVMVLAAALSVVWAMAGAFQIIGKITTTGCEEEGLFSIWKYAHHQPVYADPASLPFAASFFNWLFYVTYGEVCQTVLRVAGLDERYLPCAARLLTLGFSLGCIGLLYGLFTFLRPVGWPFGKLSWFGLSAMILVHPLTAGWIITARPDMAALFFELAALWFALSFVAGGPRWTLYTMVLAAYTAWAFKHNDLHVLLGFAAFLLLKRRWVDLFQAGGLMAGLCALTLALGGPLYRFSLVQSQAHCHVRLAYGLSVLGAVVPLAPHVAMLAVALLVLGFRPRPGSSPPCSGLLLCIAAVALVLDLGGACKQGAWTNYAIPFSILGMIWLLGEGEPPGESIGNCRLRLGLSGAVLVFFFWGLVQPISGGLALVQRAASPWFARASAQPKDQKLAGSSAAQGPMPQSELIARVRTNLDRLPGPVFCNERAINLPWLQAKNPHFVYAFTYSLDRQAGVTFSPSNIGQLIENGYFGTLLISERGCACESPENPVYPCSHITMNHLPLVKRSGGLTLDGGSLSRYQKVFFDGLFSYYARTKP